MPSRNNSSNRRPNKRNKNRGRSAGLLTNAIIRANNVIAPEPMPFNASQHWITKIRFVVVGESLMLYQILNSDIANLMAMCVAPASGGVGVITAFPLWTRYLIKKIKLFCTAASLALPATVALSFIDVGGNTTNTEMTSTDTTVSIDKYALATLTPTPVTPAGQWQTQTNTTGGFLVTAPSGAILDLTLEVYINNQDFANSFTIYSNNTSVGLGTVFMCPLDPSTTMGASHLFPQGYISTTNTTVPTPRIP
jgi:hypothetical protein